MKHATLFSGIGGPEIAAKRVGWENVFHCEINPFGRRVLNYYWPESHSLTDIHNITVDNYGNIIEIINKSVITMGQPRSTKYVDSLKLYESGMSIKECADFYEISRQAMHKILKRRGCIFRNNIKKGHENRFYRGCLKDNSKKRRVQHLVEKAIKKGVLINPKKCEICECKKTFKDGRSGIQAHHCDYDKPLDVIWMCQKCHHEWHKNNKAINQYDKEKTNEPSGAVDVLTGGFP